MLWFTSSLTSAGGKFYMYIFDKVVALDFSPEPVFTVIPADLNSASWVPCNGTKRTELVESHGDLFCVSFNHSDWQMRFIVGIAVFKLDLSTQAWVKVESSLGGRVFIVYHEFGASLDPREAGLKGDCIYYCMPNDTALYVHDMERGTTALRNPGSNLGDSCSTKVLMPTC